jgi:hypothetical protein
MAAHMTDRFASSGWRSKTKEGRRRAAAHERDLRVQIKLSQIAQIRAGYPYLAKACVAAKEAAIRDWRL